MQSKLLVLLFFFFSGKREGEKREGESSLPKTKNKIIKCLTVSPKKGIGGRFRVVFFARCSPRCVEEVSRLLAVQGEARIAANRPNALAVVCRREKIKKMKIVRRKKEHYFFRSLIIRPIRRSQAATSSEATPGRPTAAPIPW